MPSAAPHFQDTIQRILPHRYPFLLVDRVTDFVPGERIRGVKRITATESVVTGFSPDAPLAPGALLIEAVTQLGAILVLERPEMAGKIAMILQIPSSYMQRPAAPGDTAILEAEVLKIRTTTGELRGRIFLDDELIGGGQMRFAIADATRLSVGR